MSATTEALVKAYRKYGDTNTQKRTTAALKGRNLDRRALDEILAEAEPAGTRS